jgi:hypothetical protein
MKRKKKDAAAPLAAAYVDEVQAARYLSIARKSLQNWTLRGVGPRFVRLEGSVRYSLSELERYCASRIAQSTSEADRADAARKAMAQVDEAGRG